MFASKAKRILYAGARACDDGLHRFFRGDRRRVLFDGETAMHFSMFETLHGAMRLDSRIRPAITCSWDGGLKISMKGVSDALRDPAPAFIPFADARWKKWDLYVSSCFDNPWLKRSAPRADTFHGVGEKWVDGGKRLYMCHPLAARYDRLLCPNRRLADQFIVRPAFLKSSESLRLTGLAKSDVLTWFNDPEVRAALRGAMGLPRDRPLVLFAPTWGAEGLLARHGEAVLDICLRSGAALAVKLHSCSYRPETAFGGGGDWRGWMDRAAAQRGFVHLPDASLTSLMLAADFLVADFGSAAVEFCLLNRPLLFFSIPEQAAATGGDRFQFDALRRAGHDIQSLAQFEAALRGALRGEDPCVERRGELAETFFHDAGCATDACLMELYALLELNVPDGLVDQYRAARREQILKDPKGFLGMVGR